MHQIIGDQNHMEHLDKLKLYSYIAQYLPPD